MSAVPALEPAPFSLTVNVRKLSKKGEHHTFEANEVQRAEIAARYDLVSIESFVATAHAVPWRKGGVQVEGNITVKFTQPCAITAEPMDQTLEEPFNATFVPEGSKLAKPRVNGEGEIIVDAEGDDPPELFSGDTLELADIWLEFFALGIDPFAAIEGAQLPSEVVPNPEADEEEAAENSPFAALAALKKH
ncbi:YceD family protein [Pseudahrensia aquimaris]|uniref:YceD family protein n=1 Tax=Pseudahrensia aquimaris TaxID=744461 RepID=A0ABW3FAW9_9HYPH